MSSDDDDIIHLTPYKLDIELRTDVIRGRGVFTKQVISKNTLVEISSILLFTKEEYASHGKYTILDHYTYCWQSGSYALALGLGSMFNHDARPNVGFIRDFEHKLIKYVTLRQIEVGEELCISYGNNLWFEDAAAATIKEEQGSSSEEEELFPYQSDSE